MVHEEVEVLVLGIVEVQLSRFAILTTWYTTWVSRAQGTANSAPDLASPVGFEGEMA